MERRTKRALRFRFVAVFFILTVGLLLGAAKCTLFNDPPQAAFTIGPSTAGQAPFAVTLSATLSSDPDGDIETYDWDFGDGTSGSGSSVSHTYTAAGTYTITLVVTDSAGQTDRTSKTIYVTPAEPPGPTASFTASPSSGTSPLSVRFDASASTYTSYPLTYTWDFGDGGSGSGVIASHLYIGAGTYTVTLIVRGPDGKEGTATGTVTVSAPGGTTAANAPNARFDIVGSSVGVAPFQVEFDPSDSEAAAGRVLALFVWTFGDGSSASDVNAANKTHVYLTDESQEVFSVILAVYDNENDSDSITKTVKVYNRQPVAGFEIGNPPGGDGGAGLIQYVDPAEPADEYDEDDPDHQDEWVPDDVVYGNLGDLQTVSVVIRSMKIPDDDWFRLDGTKDQDELNLADGTPATSSATPDKPTDYADHNFSYDPEGQKWTGGNWPDWFPNQGWGIRYLDVTWGDGTGVERFDYNDDGDTIMYHVYNFTGDADDFTITVTAVDWLGAESDPFSRTVFLKKGAEQNLSEI